MADMPPAILIVGAGPTGLTLALELSMLKTPFRIVDKASVPSDKSRALVVHPRTLEVLRRHGIAEALMERGLPAVGARIFVHKKPAATISVENLPIPGTAFRHQLLLSQADTESLLTEHLKSTYGVNVERGVGVSQVEQDDDGVNVVLGQEDGTAEHARFSYVVGCDGAHSVVRKAAGLSFEGAAYPSGFLLCDTKLDWSELKEDPQAEQRLAAFLSMKDTMMLLPMRDGIMRLVAVESQVTDASNDTPSLAHFQALFDEVAPGKGTLHSPVWLTRFRLHHRIANKFRNGRLFVAGDAAHIHSPAGGQGMNTGIQDAVNLGWKLARALYLEGPMASEERREATSAAVEKLLESYSTERRPVGVKLLHGTDQIFSYATTRSWWFLLWRNFFVRWIAPIFLSSRRITAHLFRFASQLGIRYRRSPLSGTASGFRGVIRGGDRAPDGRVATSDGSVAYLMEGLRGDRHHLLLFAGTGAGAADEKGIDDAANQISSSAAALRLGQLEVHKIYPRASADNTALVDLESGLHKAYGFGKAGYALIRPDGHVAHLGSLTSQEELLKWLEEY